jgi:hypothetical protein
MWSRTIGTQKEWVERGETITQIISRRFIGGVTTRRDQREWMADGPSVVFQLTSGLPVTRVEY